MSTAWALIIGYFVLSVHLRVWFFFFIIVTLKKKQCWVQNMSANKLYSVLFFEFFYLSALAWQIIPWNLRRLSKTQTICRSFYLTSTDLQVLKKNTFTNIFINDTVSSAVELQRHFWIYQVRKSNVYFTCSEIPFTMMPLIVDVEFNVLFNRIWFILQAFCFAK